MTTTDDEESSYCSCTEGEGPSEKVELDGNGVSYRARQYAFSESPQGRADAKQADVKKPAYYDSTYERSEEPIKKATFDDVLTFDVYSVVLTIFYFIISLAITAQLVFMAFGGARPVKGSRRLICSYANGTSTIANVTSSGKECMRLLVKGDTVNCTMQASYKYGSIYEQFELGCYVHYAQRSAAYQNMGMILGAILGGISANNIGRKKTLIWFSAFLAAFAYCSTFAGSTLTFTMARLMVMFFAAGVHIVSNMYYIENLPAKWRSVMPTFVSYSLTYIVFAYIAHLCGEWKTLTYVSTCITIVAIIILIFLEETPAFLFSRTAKGDPFKHLFGAHRNPKLADVYQNAVTARDPKERAEQIYRLEAKEAAKRIDTFCCTRGSPEFDRKWRDAAIYHRRVTIAKQEVRKAKMQDEENDPVDTAPCQSLYKLFSNKRLKVFTLVIAYSLFTNSVVNYGIVLGIDSLPGPIWANIAITGVVRYVVNFTAIAYEVLCDKAGHPRWAGRRPVHLICASCIVLLLAAIVVLEMTSVVPQMGEGGKWLLRSLVWLVISMCNQMYIVHQVQSSETYPTPIRAFGCGLVQSANRLGTAVGPFVTSLAGVTSSLPHAIMLGLFVMDLVLYSYYSFTTFGSKYCFIKETRGKPKPEFMPGEHDEDFKKHLRETHLSASEYVALGENPYVNIDLEGIDSLRR